MATFAATKVGPWMNFGDQQAAVWKVTCDGSTQTFHTGLNSVLFAVAVSETDAGALDLMVFNSDDGTADSSMGAIHFDAETDADVIYILVIGH